MIDLSRWALQSYATLAFVDYNMKGRKGKEEASGQLGLDFLQWSVTVSEAMPALESLAAELLCCNSEELNFGLTKDLYKEGYNDMILTL